MLVRIQSSALKNMKGTTMSDQGRDGDLDHPIIDRPWTYAIAELCYSRDVDDPQSARVDLTLLRDNTIRRLRFLGVQRLSIEEGFPMCTSGLCILDASRRQLEGLAVHVSDFEASGGRVDFWAREVIDRDRYSDGL
jgi:hypothetical protein